MNANNEAKLDFFLQQAKVSADFGLLKNLINRHFTAGGDYVLFRHSSLYFFHSGRLNAVQATRDNYKVSDYLRFDGERISKLDPEYYLGPLANRRSRSNDRLLDNGSESDTNNNNNNNNNNGNNNNG